MGVMIILISLWLWWNYGEYLTLKSLRVHHQHISEYVQRYPYAAPLVYVVTVIVVVGLTLPGATVLSMAAGLVFKQPWSSLYAWLGCAIGACICYTLVKNIFADCLQKQMAKHSDWFRSFEAGLHTNELLYLIYARYMIIIPFWFVNVAAALLGVRANYFIISTFIATIPGSLLYTTAGRGLAHAFELYKDNISTWTLLKQVLFSNDIQYCLGLLLICGVVPIAIKYYNNPTIPKAKINEKSV